MLTEAYAWIVSTIPPLVEFLKQALGVLIGLSFPVSLFFFIGIIYTVERLKEVRKKEAALHDAKIEEPAYTDAGDQVMAHRWDRAMTYLESQNPNDWKQAIIEADILLDSLLTKMGYRGDSVGEKLKRVEQGDMKTRQDAWNAHLVRNDIAHKPDFQLDHHTARQTINLYRRVFEEFYYV